MVFPIAGGTQDTGAYEISNSLRFNTGDSPKLVFDPANDDNKRTMTFSFWMKPSVGDYGNHNNVLSVRPSAGSYTMLVHRTGGEFLFEINGTGDVLKTNRLFRDPSAWYHIVLAIDTTNGTASNRFKFYVNGTEETSFTTDNRSSVSQNTDLLWGGAQPHNISGDPSSPSSNYFFGGYLAEMHFVTGSQLTPSSFGETNDNGVWIPKKYTSSHGTNGFYLEFKQTGTSANASGIGADTSGGTNHFTPTNLAATDVTVDTPTNNFATLNPIDKAGNGSITFSEGNLKGAVEDNGNARGNFFVNSGKWYWETLIVSGDSVATVGIAEPGFYSGNLFDSGSTAKGYIYINNGQKRSPAGSASSYGNSYANDDIIGVALNMDDGEVKFYKNNTVQNSGTAAFTSLSGDHGIYYQGYGGTATVVLNTGQDSSFAGNKTAQNNSDGNGYGDFYYAPPSGYYSLNTKNLAEYG